MAETRAMRENAAPGAMSTPFRTSSLGAFYMGVSPSNSLSHLPFPKQESPRTVLKNLIGPRTLKLWHEMA